MRLYFGAPPNTKRNAELEDVGLRLKAVRKKSGLSQRELAKRAGVTNSTISMIEKNSVSPSISSLKKVLSGIPMSLTEFFSTTEFEAPDMPIVYPPSEFQDSSSDAHIQWDLIGKRFPNRKLVFMVETYAPGASTGDELYTHDGEEAGIILSGKLELTVENETFVLSEGEAYYFDSTRPHRYANPFEDELKLVSANTPANL